jgi:hypothetical protein
MGDRAWADVTFYACPQDKQDEALALLEEYGFTSEFAEDQGGSLVLDNQYVDGEASLSISEARGGHAKGQTIANARLIAAAPALLRALSGLVWACDGDESGDAYGDALDVAREALAQAVREGDPI